MKVLDKLRIMLPHWIEHNRGHGREFAAWAGQLQEAGHPDIADLLQQACRQLEAAEVTLQEALRQAGGPKEGHHHHGGHQEH
jgi:hypothetical protein